MPSGVDLWRFRVSAPEALIAGRYRLVRLVGTGGMGVVWEAWDERLHRQVALKQLHVQPGLSPDDAELASHRAMREARITARLHHKHAVPVFDVVEHAGQPCLIMQFLPSRPLSAVLRDRGTLPVDEAARIGAEVASALAAAHQVGIVHRDVKPGNVLIAEDGTARISDFGISHALGDVTLTSTGLVSGTPAYLAPEVARGEDASFSSDVFSLGATLYTITEGTPPFGRDLNSIALLHKVAAGTYPPPQRSGPLAPVLQRMLASDPAARPTMMAAAETLAGLVAAARAAARPAPIEPTATTAILPPATGRTPPADPAPTDVSPAASAPERVEPTPAAPTAAAAAAATPAPTVPAAGHPDSLTWVFGDREPPEPDRRSGAEDTRRPRGRAGIAVLAVAVLLAAALGLAALLRGQELGAATDTSPQTSIPPAAPVSNSASLASPAASSAAPPTPTPTTTPSPSPRAKSATPRPSTTTSTPRPSKTASARSSQRSSRKVTGSPTTAELIEAVTEYYALMPGNTDAAWPRMTENYQTNHAGGRRAYEQFWGNIARVSASNVTANPPDTAEATITYYYKNGRVDQERTRYGLVNDDGRLKIARTEVLSTS